MYVCSLVLLVSSGIMPVPNDTQKAEKQIKPIHGTKFLQGRVAPPYGDALLGVYPTSIFFLNFFSDFVLYVKFCKVVFYCL